MISKTLVEMKGRLTESSKAQNRHHKRLLSFPAAKS